MPHESLQDLGRDVPGIAAAEPPPQCPHGELHTVPRLVIVTAFGREDVRERAQEIGVDNYLLKPVTQSMLYDVLVDRRRAGLFERAT